MRPPSKALMYTDFVIQFILLVPLIVSSLIALADDDTILMAAIFMFFVGTWQGLSSLYTNLYLRLKSRRLHLVLVVLYFLIFYLILNYYNFQNRQSEIYFGYGLVGGNLIACYYCWITYLDYRKLGDEEREHLIEEDLDEDILDSGYPF